VRVLARLVDALFEILCADAILRAPAPLPVSVPVPASVPVPIAVTAVTVPVPAVGAGAGVPLVYRQPFDQARVNYVLGVIGDLLRLERVGKGNAPVAGLRVRACCACVTYMRMCGAN
jgi:hypothetical protein